MRIKLPNDIRQFFADAGRIGGKSKSEAKLKAVRINAKLGGRPKDSKNKKKKL